MQHHILLTYALLFTASLVFAFAINSFLLKFSRNLGIRNTSETIIRWSSTSKPSLGGIAFYIIFLFSIIAISFLVPAEADFFNIRSLGIIMAVTIGFLAGLFDDAYNTRPWLKFASQLLCGIILIVTGTYVTVSDHLLINYFITLFWIVGMMNSINMLDNMDAITTSVSVGIGVTLLATIFLKAMAITPEAIILVSLLGSLLAFLYFNWNPSKMYMGDTGSQFMGILMGALGIIFLWNGEAFEGESTGWMRFIAVAVVFALPITDTTTVFYKRIARGQSPFVGGRDHTTHHLSYMGLTDREVAIVFIAISTLSAVTTISMTHYVETWKPAHYFIYSAYFLVILVFLFVVGNMNLDRDVASKPENLEKDDASAS